MSYSITLAIPNQKDLEYGFTFNLSPFFKKHVRLGKESGLYALSGLSASAARLVLRAALDSILDEQHQMSANPDQISKLYEVSGYGRVHEAIAFLWRLYCDCGDHPFGELEVVG